MESQQLCCVPVCACILDLGFPLSLPYLSYTEHEVVVVDPDRPWVTHRRVVCRWHALYVLAVGVWCHSTLLQSNLLYL